ncbi:hypothetical protein MMC10_009086 [Thelotrema lepadinum]|nr:hypothetical protein [Thelotrema lepadinum]
MDIKDLLAPIGQESSSSTRLRWSKETIEGVQANLDDAYRRYEGMHPKLNAKDLLNAGTGPESSSAAPRWDAETIDGVQANLDEAYKQRGGTRRKFNAKDLLNAGTGQESSTGPRWSQETIDGVQHNLDEAYEQREGIHCKLKAKDLLNATIGQEESPSMARRRVQETINQAQQNLDWYRNLEKVSKSAAEDVELQASEAAPPKSKRWVSTKTKYLRKEPTEAKAIPIPARSPPPFPPHTFTFSSFPPAPPPKRPATTPPPSPPAPTRVHPTFGILRPAPIPPALDGSGEFECRWGPCSLTFVSAKRLHTHITEDHIGRRGGNSIDLTCRWAGCDAGTKTKRDHLTSHVKVHVGQIRDNKCEGCGRLFNRSQDLKKHWACHPGHEQA